MCIVLYIYMYLLSDHLPSRAKHPVEVRIWAGISWKETTPIVIFEGIMTAEGYQNVLREGLLPFFTMSTLLVIG